MTEAYPLTWPEGWPRTSWDNRRYSGDKFGRRLTIAKARDRLLNELRLLGVTRPPVLSSNLTLRLDGLPYSSQPKIDDPGVAIYFDLKGRPMVMAYDLWREPEANINALALAISHLRGLERHGGGFMMEKAFTGFAALPPPASAWRRILDLPEHTDLEAAHTAWREKCREAGGATLELNAAIEDARKELRA